MIPLRGLPAVVLGMTLAAPVLAQEAPPAEAPLAQDGAAAMPPEFNISLDTGWQGGAYGHPRTGAFSYCSISRLYEELDVTLVFLTNQEFQTSIGLINRDWTLTPEERLEVGLSVDDAFDRQVGAVAANEDVLVIPTGNSPEFVELIRRGNRMAVDLPGDLGTLAFPLTGTFDSMSALRNCVETANRLIAEGDPRMQARAETATEGEMTLEALATILDAGGLEEVAFLPPDQVPINELQLGFMWRTGPVIGGLHQEDRGAAVEIDAFADRFLAAFEARCPMGFTAETGPAEIVKDVYAIKTGTATCTVEVGDVAVALLFVLDDHSYSAFFHESEVENRAAVEAATASIERVVRQMAGMETEEGAAAPSAEATPEAGGAAAPAEGGEAAPAASAEQAPAAPEGEAPAEEPAPGG